MGDENFGDTEATTWTGEHYPISVTISSNLIQEPNLFSNPIARDLVSSFIDALKEIFSNQSKVQMKTNFFQTETTKESVFARILETPNQRCSLCVGIEAEDNNFENSSRQLQQTQKNQLLDLRE